VKTILVVEDDRLLARLVELNLTAEGYNVVVYNEGINALAYLQTHRPNLVLLDLMLPTVSGWDFLAFTQQDKNLSRIPVLAITALARPDEQARTLAAGAVACLVKPFGIHQLFATVDRLLVSIDDE